MPRGRPAESEGYPQRPLHLRELLQSTREKPSPCQPDLDRHYSSSPGTTGGICFSVDILSLVTLAAHVAGDGKAGKPCIFNLHSVFLSTKLLRFGWVLGVTFFV